MARAPGGNPGDKKQETVWCIFNGQWGIVPGSLPSDLKTSSKPCEPFFNGTIYTNGISSSPSSVGLALASPTDAAKFLLPGWSQSSMVIANCLSNIMESIGSKSLWQFREDKAMSEQVATQLAILWSIVFVDAGSDIHIPAIIAGKFSFQKKTMSYSDAVSFLGLKSIVDASPAAIISKYPQKSPSEWSVFSDALSSAIIDLSSKSTALHITQSGLASDWTVVSKSIRFEVDEWRGLSFPPPPSLFKVTVNATDVKMRDKPSTSSKTICLMQKGQLLYQLASPDKNKWVEIFNPSAGYGFVSSTLISKDSEPVKVAEVKEGGGVSFDKKEPEETPGESKDPYTIPEGYTPVDASDLTLPEEPKKEGLSYASIALAAILLGGSITAIIVAARSKKAKEQATGRPEEQN